MRAESWCRPVSSVTPGTCADLDPVPGPPSFSYSDKHRFIHEHRFTDKYHHEHGHNPPLGPTERTNAP